METIIIEELNRNHKLLSRHKYHQSSIQVGRSYYNDVILSDPHVCPDHLNIEFDGVNWRIKDLESVNGSFLSDRKKNADQHIIQSGDVISIGKTLLRFVFPHHPMAKSIAFGSFESFINIAKKPVVLILSILLFSLLTAYSLYIQSGVKLEVSKLIAPVIGACLLAVVWPLAVGLVSHFTKNDARIWSQIGITFILMNILFFVGEIERVFYFNSSASSPLALISIIYIAISFCYFWLNAYIGFEMSEKRRHFVAAGLVVLFFGGYALVDISKSQDFSSLPNYDSTLMPPNYLLRDGISIDEFINDSAILFEQAIEDAQKKD